MPCRSSVEMSCIIGKYCELFHSATEKRDRPIQFDYFVDFISCLAPSRMKALTPYLISKENNEKSEREAKKKRAEMDQSAVFRADARFCVVRAQGP